MKNLLICNYSNFSLFLIEFFLLEFNLEIDHDYHKKLLHLYVILFSSKLNNKSINLIINEEKPNSDDKALSNEEKEKKVNKISDKITQRIENDSVCEIKQESTSNYVETIFTLCTKIYQYFYIIQTFNDEACKYIQFFEKGHKYTISTDPNSKYTSVTTWNHSHFPKF